MTFKKRNLKIPAFFLPLLPTAIFLLLISCIGSATAQSETPSKIKVAVTVKSAGGEVLPIHIARVRGNFRQTISSLAGYEAFERADLDNAVAELKLQQSGMVSDEDKKKLGDFGGVDIILSVTLVEGLGYLSIEATFIEVQTGKILKTVSDDTPGNNIPQISTVCQKLAQELTGKLTGTVIDDNSGAVTHKTQNGNSASGQNQTFTVGGVSFTMIFVKGGSFTMGCTSEQNGCEDYEKPAHRVTLSDYYIGETEVTVEQFAAFIDATGYKTDAEKDGGSVIADWKKGELVLKQGVTWLCDANGNYRSRSEYTHPVIHVSWNDAIAYCNWLSQQTGQKFALPTEAQWEYAARGGSKSMGYPYSGSSNIGSVAVYWDNYGQTYKNTAPVKSKSGNELGLYDMSGNVYEWCSDWYGDYSSSAQTNPQGANSGSNRVARGGSWGSIAEYCRVAYRYNYTPDDRDGNLGFRLASVQ